MTTMNVEIYDAAKFPEKPARTIATVLDRETKKEAIEGSCYALGNSCGYFCYVDVCLVNIGWIF